MARALAHLRNYVICVCLWSLGSLLAGGWYKVLCWHFHCFCYLSLHIKSRVARLMFSVILPYLLCVGMYNKQSALSNTLISCTGGMSGGSVSKLACRGNKHNAICCSYIIVRNLFFHILEAIKLLWKCTDVAFIQDGQFFLLQFSWKGEYWSAFSNSQYLHSSSKTAHGFSVQRWFLCTAEGNLLLGISFGKERFVFWERKMWEKIATEIHKD